MITQVSYQDASSTPQVSPLAATTNLALVVPSWANRLTIKAAVAWKHGQGSMAGSSDGNGYCNASADAWNDFPVVANGMFRGVAGSSTTWEYFFYREE